LWNKANSIVQLHLLTGRIKPGSDKIYYWQCRVNRASGARSKM